VSHEPSPGEERPAARVLFVSHSADLYGAERSLLSVVKGLKERGSVDPLVLVPRRGPLLERLAAAGVAVRVERFRWWAGPRGERFVRGLVRFTANWSAARRIAASLRLLHLDLVYSNTLVCPLGALLARRLGLPHVWHFREFVEEDFGLRFDLGRRAAMALVRRSADLVLCNSQAVMAKFARWLPPARMRVVYNGLDGDAFAPEPEGSAYARRVAGRSSLLLTIVGSVQPAKGQEDAVRALSILRRGGLDVRLAVVGSGREGCLRRLADLARELGVDDSVDWRGFVLDPAPHLASAAAALVCSRSEAYGRTAVEAMAAGVPVVAARSGGLPELITHGETGFLYRPGDPMDLAAKVRDLLADPQRYDAVVAKAWASASSRFRARRCVEEVEAEVLRLTTRRPRPAQPATESPKFRALEPSGV
jgi:glycosyltransferase involved in cell wall biosynthesis